MPFVQPTPEDCTTNQIDVVRDGHILRVTLNDPENLNVFDENSERAFRALFEAIQLDEETRVVVLTGTGTAFNAGGNVGLNLNYNASHKLANKILGNARRMVMAMLDCEKPILARINGDAVGLGATIALLCDITFMVDTARIGDPHIKVGLVAGDGGALIWPLLVGPARAKQYLLSGDLLTAPEAAAMGLVNFSVPADELDALVDKWANRLARSAPHAIQGTKAAINAAIKLNAAAALDLGFAREAVSISSKDLVEAVNSFYEKRRPDFQGE
ncbi:MAG: enoyl-CoA hydratase/isomerase family protein [Acidimicrobiia bacterium]